LLYLHKIIQTQIKTFMENVERSYQIEQWTVRDLLNRIHAGEIELNDSTLQRREIASRDWSSKLITSVIKGRSINAIHFAWSLNDNNERVLTCVDGLQRSTAILKFDQGKVHVPANTQVAVLENGERKIYNLTTELKRTKTRLIREGKEELLNTVFYNRVIDVYVYNNLSAKEIQHLFVLLNSGNVIKDQERRNAFPTPIADKIRELARGKDVRDEDGNVISIQNSHPLFDGQNTGNSYKAEGILKFKNDRYAYDELVAKMLFLEYQGNVDDPSSKDLDTMYRETSHILHGDNYNESRFPRMFSRISRILDRIYNLIMDTDSTDRSFQKKTNDFLIFYRVMKKLLTENKSIQDAERFLNEYETAYHQSLYTTDQFGQTVRTRIKGQTLVDRVYTILMSRPNNGIVNQDSSRTFSEEMRRRKWEEQGKICAYTGEPLDFEDAAGDHVIPFVEGGPTEYWNLAVVDSNLNSKRGKKPWAEWMIINAYEGCKGDMLPPMPLDKIQENMSKLTNENPFFEQIFESKLTEKV